MLVIEGPFNVVILIKTISLLRSDYQDRNNNDVPWIKFFYSLYVFRGIIIPLLRLQEPVILYDILSMYEKITGRICKIRRKRASSILLKKKYDEEFYSKMETNNVFLSS